MMKTRVILLVVFQVLPIVLKSSVAFTIDNTLSFRSEELRINTNNRRTSNTDCCSSKNSGEANEWTSSSTDNYLTTRRNLITDCAKVLTASTILLAEPKIARSAVFVDPDRYGDKEIKTAFINRVRQNIRDILVQNPKLAPLFLKVAIQDALTYNAKTDEGGPDGTIVQIILQKQQTNPNLIELVPAAEELNNLRIKLKRTTEITMADLVAFAGAEAIETVGGPRVVVQIGKIDPTTITTNIKEYPDLSSTGKNNGEGVLNAFQRSGLTERDVALVYGTIIAVENVVNDATAVEEENDPIEVNEMGEQEVDFPSSFGGPKQKYGKQIGALDKSIFKSIVSEKKKYSKVLEDKAVEEWAQTYAKKKANFVKDLAQEYGKWMALGAQYTGGNIGSLLDGS